MNNNPGTLSDEDVRQIATLVETLERSAFDYLQVELGDLKVTLGKGMPPNTALAEAPMVRQVAPAVPISAPARPGIAPPAAQTPPPAGRSEAVPQEGSIAVLAPTVGRFYAKPEPSAPPFVSVGAAVGPESTVALIEVMKMFTAVPAGIDGVVVEVCVQNEQFVEYGQVLFRIRPATTPV